MKLLTRVRELCKSRGTTVANVEKAVGFNKTIYNWDKYMPSVDKVALVADYFGISIDELVGRTPPAVSKSERMLLDLLDQLNEDGKGAAIAMLQGLANQPEYKKGHTSEELEA